jgi:hypothetical protein
MTSQIDTSKIDTTFPIPGRDNDSQGFRTNFSSIKQGLTQAATEISDLQRSKANLTEPSWFIDQTQATSTQTGAIRVNGGVGIGQDLYVGGNVHVNGNIVSSGTNAIITTSTLAPAITTAPTDVTWSGTYGQPKFSISSSITGNKTFKNSISAGVVNPYPGDVLIFAGTTQTNQIGVYVKTTTETSDGTDLVLDTKNDTSGDGNFSFIEFRKTPGLTPVTLGAISLGASAGSPTLEVSGDWEFTGNVVIPNLNTGSIGVSTLNGSKGAVQLQNLTDFGRILATNGFQKLPGGLLMQWGNTPLGGGAGQVITFPIAFTTCYVVNGNSINVANGANMGITEIRSTCTVCDPSTAATFSWTAIGV